MGGLSDRIVLAGGSDYNQCFAQAGCLEAWNLKPMLYYLLTALYVFVCLLLLLVILLQQGKGGDMASAFGGGSSQTAFGARGGATLLAKVTAVCSVIFMLGALALAIIGQRGPSSVVGGTAAPRPPAGAPAPAAPAATGGSGPSASTGAPAAQPPATPAPVESAPASTPASPATPAQPPTK